jgi:hypothetical protein
MQKVNEAFKSNFSYHQYAIIKTRLIEGKLNPFGL